MSVQPHVIDTLRSRLPAGAVSTPDSADYDSARQMFSGSFDSHPGVIARVATTDDVVAVLGAARESGAELAVRGGRHAASGFSTCDGGIVLDTCGLDSFDLDLETRTVWAGAGLTAAAYTQRAGEHGLVTGFGDTGSVGIAGLTLGGGVGLLSRLHGLTIDNLLGVELVSADGQVVTADADHHPELFWALRGGGGGFGVVTRLHLRLHHVPEIYGGMLMLPATAQTIAGAIRASQEAPRELTTIVNVLPCPPVPFAPEEVHGTPVVMILLAYAGDPAQGERAVGPLRAVAPPVADFLQAGPYSAMFQPVDPDYHPSAVGRTLFLDHVDEQVAATALSWLARSDASLRAVQLRVLGGAISDVPADATAFAHRNHPIMANVANFVDHPDQLPARVAWADGFADALDQGHAAAYANFVGPEGDSAGRLAYPAATADRLLKVKREYDPQNLFSRSYPLEPRP